MSRSHRRHGRALIWMGALVIAVTAIDAESVVAKAVYLTTAVGLLVLAGVSWRTGFKFRFRPFRLCPFIFSVWAALILLGGVVG